jgi:hypothetical protein
MNPEPVPAWGSPKVFSPKPVGQDYGYLAGGRTRGCSKDELIRLCERDQVPPIHLVWTPETPGLTTPAKISFLSESLKARNHSRVKIRLILSLLHIIFFGALCAAFWNRAGESRWWLLLFSAAFLGVLPFIRAVRQLSSARVRSQNHGKR